MLNEIIALDLETTGLDQYEDEIIQVGIARFKDGKVLETYETLVNPGIPIPSEVVNLTGISNDDVEDAPMIDEVLDAIAEFIGDGVIVGHNIQFDINFLSRYRIAYRNPYIDTYELASVLIPNAPRYNLTSLTDQLEINLENAHDALADAIAAAHLYWSLWQKLNTLPFDTIQEIVSMIGNIEWGASVAFQHVYELRMESDAPEPEMPRVADPFEVSDEDWGYLRPKADVESIDPDEVAGIIEPDGVLSKYIDGYESRPSQVEMLREVAESFNQHHHLMVEAPTGTGKSIAYTLPAIYWAMQNRERVVISTATIALQDQLINKDLPLLQETLDIDFKASVIKGRSNYLCPRRLNVIRRRQPTSDDELRVVAKILVWLLEESSGDKNYISLRGKAENLAWRRLSAEDEGCNLSRCADNMMGSCPFYKARKKAEAAHVLIVNHSLLLSDVAIGNKVLPEYRYLIVDEAHHLEDAATNGLSLRIDRNGIRRRFDDLGDTSKGLLGSVLGGLKGNIEEKHFEQMQQYIKIVVNAISSMTVHVEGYFKMLLDCFVESGQHRPNDYNSQIRVTSQMRQRGSWSSVEQSWEPLSEFFKVLSQAMDEIAKAMNSFDDYDIPNYEDLLISVQTAARYLAETYSALESFTLHPDENTIYWCEIGRFAEWLTINAAPLHVGPMIDQYLWSEKDSIVLASATLQTAGSFEYIRERLYADDSEVKTISVETPFDYQESTLIYLPSDMPEPNNRHAYQECVEQGIIDMALALDGRVLGLFTSYNQLVTTSKAITNVLAKEGITVYNQASGSSRDALIEGFKSSEKAVLLGTRSFWEGVDLPGEDLQGVAIARLPFTVPSDPIFSARSEQFQNSFMEYAVPDAILRFRQGFGRLIRRSTDRGVVVIFDKRVTSKRYGKLFIESLPECTVYNGTLSKIREASERWINR